jgi:hypothetical protein
MAYMRSRKNGFSLAEAVLAVFLFASVIGYSISAFIVSRHASKLSRERIIVSNLLREDMENFLNVNYADIVDGPVSTDITINDGSRTFSATKTLEPNTVVAGIYGYKRIYAKIAWAGGISGDKPLEEEMVMYVTKK